MNDRVLFSPSILSADFTCLGEEIAQAEASGADWIHVDVMDGHFVPNLTMGPFIVAASRRATRLPIEAHLMISAPERLLESFAHAGADRLIVHQETCPHLHRTLQAIRELDCEAGVALNPGTPVAAIVPVLHLVDLVLVMTVNPGFSGQTFLPEVLPKISRLSEMLRQNELSPWIEVDGGINAETLPRTYAAGARVFVAATAIFKYPGGISAGLEALRASLD